MIVTLSKINYDPNNPDTPIDPPLPGQSDAALSNMLGSNTFDILICLGLPIFYIGGIYINYNESFFNKTYSKW